MTGIGEKSIAGRSRLARLERMAGDETLPSASTPDGIQSPVGGDGQAKGVHVAADWGVFELAAAPFST